MSRYPKIEVNLSAADIHSDAGAVSRRVLVPLYCCHVFTLVPTTSMVRGPGQRMHAKNGPILAYRRSGMTSMLTDAG